MIKEMGGDYLQWLRGFYYVAKTGSFSMAGREIGRNQPTISHQIKCLENEYGVALLKRSKEKAELTPEGKILFEKVISIFEIMKSIRGEMIKTPGQFEGQIRIVSTHAVIQSYLPKYIVNFKKDNPKVVFNIHGGGLKKILEMVESSEADFGFLNLESVPDGLIYHDLFDTKLVLVAPKKINFPEKNSVTLEQIAEQPFIFFPHTSTITPLIEKKFADNNLNMDVVMVLNNFDIVKRYIELGMGVTILDDFTITPADKTRLGIYQLNHYFDKRSYGMVIRKTKYLSPTVKAFIQSIKPNIQL